MGGSFSATPQPWDWTPSGASTGEYDGEGYLPPGLKPMSTAYDTFHLGGKAAVLGPYAGSQGSNVNNPGIINGALTMLGTGDAFTMASNWGTYDNVYPLAKTATTPSTPTQPVTATTWHSSWRGCSAGGGRKCICTPENYPNCDMSAIRDNTLTLATYDNKEFQYVDNWREGVEKAYDNFTDPGWYDAMQQVNMDETTTYDPCANTSFLEILLPAVAGLAAVLVYRETLAPLMQDMLTGPMDSDLLEASLGLFCFFMTKGSMEAFGEPTPAFKYASYTAIVPAAVVGGRLLGFEAVTRTNIPLSPTEGELLGVVLTGALLLKQQSYLELLLDKGNIAKFVLSAVIWVMRTVSHFLCSLTQDSFEACDNITTFPTARRWDVPSVAGMLTQEVCDREGWDVTDPKAEFVFKGLLTGPGMMAAATEETKTDLYQNVLVNPLGGIYVGRWEQSLGSTPTQVPTYGRGTGLEFGHGTRHGADGLRGWDGDMQISSLDVANSNLYACQKWEVLRNGAQQTQTTGTALVKRNFDSWIGVDDWTEGDPVGSLVEAAYDPNKLAASRLIKGWDTEPDIGLPNDCDVVIAQVLKATSMQERAQWAESALSNPCPDPNMANWLLANATYYYLMIGMDSPTELWLHMTNNDPAACNDPSSTFCQVLSYDLQAITAFCPGGTCNNKGITSFWDLPMPQGMMNTLNAYPPLPNLPKSYFASGPVVLQGLPGSLKEMSCAQLLLCCLGQSVGCPLNATLEDYADAINTYLHSSECGVTCNVVVAAQLYVFLLVIEADQSQNGIGFVLDNLQLMNTWAPPELAAAMQMLYKLEAPSPFASSVAPLFDNLEYNGVDWQSVLWDPQTGYMVIPANWYAGNLQLKYFCYN